MRKILVFVIALISGINLFGANQYDIIPYPDKLVKKDGFFEFKTSLRVTLPANFKTELDLLTKTFADEYLVKISSVPDGKLIFRENKSLEDEAYNLSITSERIIAEASSPAGCFHAIQTLRQLLTLTGSGSYRVANCTIQDKPAFAWRAYLLDEGRYFKGKKVVKMMLDEMALMKMNILQWHLTDDAGWRIEIKKYPLLTEKGAWRDSTQAVNWESDKYHSYAHGGFYTQDDIREIVRYADQRHITIVPEIEMPGHMSAAIAAYPWLGASGKSINVPVNFGVKYDVLNVADEKVYGFIQDVLKEVMDLFPGKVIHIGGDEVRADHWKQSQAVTALMQKEGLKNYSDVHVYFTNRISNFIEKSGRRMMGWNDILGKNVHEWSAEANSTRSLAKNTIIHFWKGDPSLVNDAIAQGYDVVNSYHEFTYLDYDYKSIPLEKAYSFNPVPAEVPADRRKQILGLGCQMWGEWIPSVADMERKTFPRIAAYAEDGWTGEVNKDYSRFLTALEKVKRHWDGTGIIYGE